MRRASDEGVHHDPGHLAQAGPQDTGDAGHGTRTRLPGSARSGRRGSCRGGRAGRPGLP